MTWNAAYTIRDAVEAKFTGSAFALNLAAVNTSASTSAPHIATDAGKTGGYAVYTYPQTTYQFPCVEITPPEGTLDSISGDSTTSVVSIWVYLLFRGSAKDLDEWALTYLTALTRTFLTDTTASGYAWAPQEFSASPIGATNAEGTFVQGVGIRVEAAIAESL